MSENKFQFDIDFQWSIIRFIVKDKYGYKALSLIKHTYFEVDDQMVITHALSRFFRRKKRVPSSASVLNQELNKLFKTRDYAQELLSPDKDRIKRRVKKLYKTPVKDGDEILFHCKQFASYVELRNTLEGVELQNYDSYATLSKNIQKAVNLGIELDQDKGTFMVGALKHRLLERHNHDTIIPTPYSQINRLTNAGGYGKGSVIVLVDRPKKGKTMTMVNFAKDYMSRKGNNKTNKKVIYFDLENGQESISLRIDELVINKNKKQIISGDYDKDLEKQYRRFRRMGGEVYVIRMRNNSTTDDFQKELDDVYHEYGIKFDVAIVDYAAIMGATTGAKDDLNKISDAYLDLKNWAKFNDFDHVITGHHVVRKAYDKRDKVYETSDLAKCIDIERHVDTLFGIQQNAVEEELGVLRLEIMEQRDGFPNGAIYFHVDVTTQRLKEFTREEVKQFVDGQRVENRAEEKTKRKSIVKTDLNNDTE